MNYFKIFTKKENFIIEDECVIFGEKIHFKNLIIQ